MDEFLLSQTAVFIVGFGIGLPAGAMIGIGFWRPARDIRRIAQHRARHRTHSRGQSGGRDM